jgi:hypothetical protein
MFQSKGNFFYISVKRIKYFPYENDHVKHNIRMMKKIVKKQSFCKEEKLENNICNEGISLAAKKFFSSDFACKFGI